MLLVQRGKELGYQLSDEQFKSWLDNIRKEHNLEDEEVPGGAEAGSMTHRRSAPELEKQMLVSQVQHDEVGSKLSITEDEARQYYRRTRTSSPSPRPSRCARS